MSSEYEFLACKLGFSDPSDKATIFATDDFTYEIGWGHSPEEAFQEAQEISVYLLEHGWSVEYQRYAWELRDVNSTPINDDTRIMPNVEFEVRVPELWRDSEGFINIPDDAWK